MPLIAWARDLSAAYRMWGVQRATLFLQAFVWEGGVCVDERLEFGTASAVQAFQRLSSLLIALVRKRQLEWDTAIPIINCAGSYDDAVPDVKDIM